MPRYFSIFAWLAGYYCFYNIAFKTEFVEKSKKQNNFHFTLLVLAHNIQASLHHLLFCFLLLLREQKSWQKYK